MSDETWIGGQPKNRHKADRAMARGFGYEGHVTDKTPVLSLISADTGEVRSRVVPNVTGPTLRKVMAEQVDITGSHLQTDEGTWYGQLGREFLSHETVNHSVNEYVRGNVTTNRAEGYFGQLKSSLTGTHHHVSKEHLGRYLAEFDFRYSTCKLSDSERTEKLMRQTGGKRLTYRAVRERSIR